MVKKDSESDDYYEGVKKFDCSGCESGVSVCRFDLAVRWRRRFCDGIWWWMRAYEAQ